MLVARTLNGNTDLEIASNLRKIFTLRVEEGYPLVLDDMLVLEVDCGHVELVCADHLVTEDSFVHHLYRDSLHFNLA